MWHAYVRVKQSAVGLGTADSALLPCAGKTQVHVVAVSSGNPTPYPNVNNTERWQTLAASCPYEFTILGRDEVWLGDKGVTKNKLMYYAKCDVRRVL